MLTSRFLLVALVATATSALAVKPTSVDARINVPFSFTVDGKRCPAGTYQVKGDAANNWVSLVGRDSSKIFSWIVVPNSEADPTKVSLQFDRTGADHTLRSIQYGSQSTLRLDMHKRQSDEQEDTARGGR
jgi:hypothetical protein